MSKISWDDQRIFYAVLEAGSLSGAARQLGLSHPTVRARIDNLERDLGAVLFTRSVSGLAPTDVAVTLGDTVRKMVLASELFVRQATAVSGEIAGTVRLSISEVMGLEVIPPMLVTLREKHPSLKIELVLSNRQANILDHEVDIAVRNAVPRQQALVARRVRQVPIGFFAAHAYVARRGLPDRFEDIFSHELVGPDRDQTDLAAVEAIGSQLFKCFVLRTDSQPAQMAAARAGVGIGAFQVPIGEADTRLVRVLPDFVIDTMDVWLVTHENLAKTPGVRAVLDHLALEFGK
jgi:DNA-binding transcriptional LysR family regulator